MIYILFNQNNADHSHLKKAITTSDQRIVEGKAGAIVYDKEDCHIGKPTWHLRAQNTDTINPGEDTRSMERNWRNWIMRATYVLAPQPTSRTSRKRRRGDVGNSGQRSSR